MESYSLLLLITVLIPLAGLMLFYFEGKFTKQFCSHDYIKTDSFVLPSEFDMIIERGYRPHTYSNTTRIYVTDMKCTKCSKHKRLTVTTKN